MDKIMDILKFIEGVLSNLTDLEFYKGLDWSSFTSSATIDFVSYLIIMVTLVTLIVLGIKGLFVGAKYSSTVTVRAMRKLTKKTSQAMFSRNPEICSSCGKLLEDCSCEHNKGLSTRKRYKNFKKEKKRIRKGKKIKAKALKTAKKLARK